MRQKRLYALFEMQDGKWVQISTMTLPLTHARTLWQDKLLAYALGYCPNQRSLKPVKGN